jgi:chromosomal replication initiator protein
MAGHVDCTLTLDGTLLIDGVLQFDFPASGVASPPGRGASFVVGPENLLAAAPLESLMSSSDLTDIAERFNPLVLVGPSGSGKSHIACGLVRTWSARLGDAAVAYLTAADFGRERQGAEIEKRLDAWRGNLRAKKLLVVEDIDRLRPKTTIQCEASDTIDAIIGAGGLVVVTSLVEPIACGTLSAYLRDRLVAGLTVRFQRPERAARRAILAQAATARGVPVNAEQLDSLAARDCSTPAQALGRLARFENSAVAAELPPDTTVEQHPADAVSLKQVLAVTARYFNVTQAALTGPSRRASLVEARNVIVHLARRLTGLSYAAIGRGLGGRDHTTIMHADRRMAERMASDPAIYRAVGDLEKLLH